jgi:hypothetical protein
LTEESTLIIRREIVKQPCDLLYDLPDRLESHWDFESARNAQSHLDGLRGTAIPPSPGGGAINQQHDHGRQEFFGPERLDEVDEEAELQHQRA